MEISSPCMADDMVCLADSDEGLQNMLNTLEIFCRENRLQINTDKTECMIFNKWPTYEKKFPQRWHLP